jgi:hypothetical protein
VGSPGPSPRASDAEREAVARRLHDAVGEGRLTQAEADERLAVLWTTRTQGELAPLVADLPGPVAPPGPPPRPTGGSLDLAVMTGVKRSGEWVVGPQHRVAVFWGGAELDLRRARFATDEVRLDLVAVMGGIEVVVPDEVERDARGIGLMGGFETPPTRARPGARRVVVRGVAFWGGVRVRWASDVPPRKG